VTDSAPDSSRRRKPGAPVDKPDWRGRLLDVEVGPVAHGGHCVARFEGRVIFVRHALPDEQVTVQVTEDNGGSFCRADAVQIHRPSPHRVSPPCRYAHPGGCGGCDFQHVALPEQRNLKAAVVAEQLERLAGLSWPVTVQPLPVLATAEGHSWTQVDTTPEPDGLRWRRRIRFATGTDGRLGLRVHRSHRTIPVTDCLIGAPGVGDAAELQSIWPPAAELEIACDDRDEVAVLQWQPAPGGGSGSGRQRARQNSRHRGRAERPRLVSKHLTGPEELHYEVAGHQFQTRAGGFWQTHPAAAARFTAAVLDSARPRPGERALDLYAGAGLFTAVLADAVTASGGVLGLEADASAVGDAEQNLRQQPWAVVRREAVTPATIKASVSRLGGSPEVVVLDPPRTGAGRDVMRALLELLPRVVCYVACDPAALARDLRTATELGWQLTDLVAFDAFPMTHHVECVATLRPGPAAQAATGGAESAIPDQ
jgi:tRNA/tmRNA/rRNA uracil-C5-methylase (TrmA/RlmC/RlmD family)